MKRAELLETAKTYVTKDRADIHGEAEDNFRLIADMWNAYLGEWADIKAHDVAVMMSLFKIARLKFNPGNKDNWVDIAGYAACGGEIATRMEETKL